MDEQIIADVEQWLDEVVIASTSALRRPPAAREAMRIAVSHASTADALLEDLQAELGASDNWWQELETTLAIPDMLEDFADYNDFLDAVDLWVEQFG